MKYPDIRNVHINVHYQDSSCCRSGTIKHIFISIKYFTHDHRKVFFSVSGIKKIEQELYKDFSDKHFGPQIAMTVQLCSMSKPKVNDYYHIEYEVSL